ncbi:MAG TPA: glycosyltransferase family 25 protein [Burkholderiales bacterium]|nr:glycosyltransferase family 25 protein [Burkholderiales bacterium]
MTTILLISMRDAHERRRLMLAQLELPGMPPYRIIDGIDGRRLSAEQRAQIYDDVAAQRRFGRDLTPGEIGCAASHFAAYRRIVAEGIGVALILEDDALLGNKVLDVLERLQTRLDPARSEAILLSHVVRYSSWGARRIDKIHWLCRPYEAYGGHGYLITMAGAQAMLSAVKRIATVADDWRHHFKGGILRVSAVVPYVVGTSPTANESQIGERLASGGPLARWLQKYLWGKFIFQLFVKPALRLWRQEQTW